jgi:hypothetical protein
LCHFRIGWRTKQLLLKFAACGIELRLSAIAERHCRDARRSSSIIAPRIRVFAYGAKGIPRSSKLRPASTSAIMPT